MPRDTAQGNKKAPLPMKEGAFEVPCDGVALLSGAGCRIRTDDLPLTRRVLYQLS